MKRLRLSKIRYFLCCIMLSLSVSQTVRAEEFISAQEPVEIIFVIDCSGSMKANDPSKMGLNMVQAFIDTVQTENVRIGYVAYNDGIRSYAAPESMEEEENRESLKEEIGAISYAGDTDIGLGLSHAHGLFTSETGSRKTMVLISDGETDLPENNGRTEEQSNQELEQCIRQSKEENIQIYTVAFGQYEGSGEVLQDIAAETGAESYAAKDSEDLIKVLYGIFQDKFIYQIRQFSNGTYARGSQEIRCVLNAPYFNEMNILLVSSEPVGEATVQYGGEEIRLTGLSHYAVGKIRNAGADAANRELVVCSETTEGQDLKVYIISYRKLVPVLQIATNARRNQELEYQVYFEGPDGNIIENSEFYETFVWKFAGDGISLLQESAELSDGVLKGTVNFSQSGVYDLYGILSDEFGSYSFPIQIKVTNAMPQGNIPEDSCTLSGGGRTLCLDDYFADPDGDILTYSVADVSEETDVLLEGNRLTVTPHSPGIHSVEILASDGEKEVRCVYSIRALPLWRAYWWVTVPIGVLVVFLLWRLFQRPKPELERLTEEKRQNSFNGKLNAYFILQPEEEEEIPPLSFQMNKIDGGRVSLGALFGAYPEQAAALQLQDIFLIADENRTVILYHESKSGVMVGTAIACKQTQYHISFGDIIYITSPEGDYDLEIHYVALFQ